jgi:DNA helicase HerA-like ATPase
LSKADARRFLLDFAERLYQRQRRPAAPVPRGGPRVPPADGRRGDDANLVGAWQRIVKQGRFKGLGCTLITQRSAALNKDVLTQVDTLIVLRTTSPQDQKPPSRRGSTSTLESHDMLASSPRSSQR